MPLNKETKPNHIWFQLVKYRSSFPLKHNFYQSWPKALFLFSVSRNTCRNCCNTASIVGFFFFFCSLEGIYEPLCLAVVSRVARGNCYVLYHKHFIKSLEFFWCKLGGIIRNNRIWQPEPHEQLVWKHNFYYHGWFLASQYLWPLGKTSNNDKKKIWTLMWTNKFNMQTWLWVVSFWPWVEHYWWFVSYQSSAIAWLYQTFDVYLCYAITHNFSLSFLFLIYQDALSGILFKFISAVVEVPPLFGCICHCKLNKPLILLYSCLPVFFPRFHNKIVIQRFIFLNFF